MFSMCWKNITLGLTDEDAELRGVTSGLSSSWGFFSGDVSVCATETVRKAIY